MQKVVTLAGPRAVAHSAVVDLSRGDVVVQAEQVVRVLDSLDVTQSLVVRPVCGLHPAGVVGVEVVDVGAVGHIWPQRVVDSPSPGGARVSLS